MTADERDAANNLLDERDALRARVVELEGACPLRSVEASCAPVERVKRLEAEREAGHKNVREAWALASERTTDLNLARGEVELLEKERDAAIARAEKAEKELYVMQAEAANIVARCDKAIARATAAEAERDEALAAESLHLHFAEGTLARAEKAEKERDEARAACWTERKNMADEYAEPYRAALARAEKAEMERDAWQNRAELRGVEYNAAIAAAPAKGDAGTLPQDWRERALHDALEQVRDWDDASGAMDDDVRRAVDAALASPAPPQPMPSLMTAALAAPAKGKGEKP